MLKGILENKPEILGKADKGTHQWMKGLQQDYATDIQIAVEGFLSPDADRDGLIAEITSIRKELVTLCKEVKASDADRKAAFGEVAKNTKAPIEAKAKEMRCPENCNKILVEFYKLYVQCIALATAASTIIEETSFTLNFDNNA